MEHKIEIRDLHYRVPTVRFCMTYPCKWTKTSLSASSGQWQRQNYAAQTHLPRPAPGEEHRVHQRREIEAFSYRETARQVTVMRQENGSDFDYTILEMVLMGRAPYRKFYERDTAEDKQIAYNACASWVWRTLPTSTFPRFPAVKSSGC